MSVALTARIDAVAAHVALERGRSDEASALAHAAVAAAAATDQPEVECEALQVLGRLGRQHEPGRGRGLVGARSRGRRATPGSRAGTCGPGTSWR